MIAEVGAVVFRQRMGEMLSHIQYGGDTVVVTKDGSPVAAVIDIGLFNRIRTMNARFEQLCAKVGDGYADVPEEIGLAEIDAAVTSVRRG